MSDNWICIIPKDPNWTPSSAQQIELEMALRSIVPPSEKVEFETDDDIKFRDCGGNFESIKCPNCKVAVNTEQWQSLMDIDYDGNSFRMCKYQMDCCGCEVSLNELEYYFTQGFSKFIARCMNPNKGELAKNEIRSIEEALTTTVSVIYQHI
jgi:hypothetical protein